MQAVADHGEIAGDQVTGNYDDARSVLDALERLGISYADVTAVLEGEGVDKFATSWAELLADVQAELTKTAL
jgi:transaldolase